MNEFEFVLKTLYNELVKLPIFEGWHFQDMSDILVITDRSRWLPDMSRPAIAIVILYGNRIRIVDFELARRSSFADIADKYTYQLDDPNTTIETLIEATKTCYRTIEGHP